MGSAKGTLRRGEAWVSSMQRLVDGAIIIIAQIFIHLIYREAWREGTMTVTAIGLVVFGFSA